MWRFDCQVESALMTPAYGPSIPRDHLGLFKRWLLKTGFTIFVIERVDVYDNPGMMTVARATVTKHDTSGSSQVDRLIDRWVEGGGVAQAILSCVALQDPFTKTLGRSTHNLKYSSISQCHNNDIVAVFVKIFP